MTDSHDQISTTSKSSVGTARTRDGATIAYTLWRAEGPARPRLALVHSLAMDRSFWDRLLALITEDVDVLVYDCRGHGASSKPEGPYTVELFAADLADLMDAVGWASATVAGASMGGCVTLAFGAAYPQRTDGLGLIDTTAYYGDDAPQKWAERATKAKAEGMKGLAEFQKSRWLGDAFREANPEVLQKAMAVFLANDVDAYGETCRMLGAADKRQALPNLLMPVAIVVGEEDYATPVAMAQAMKDAIPHATMEVIAGARHFTPLEVPADIAAVLKRLMKVG